MTFGEFQKNQRQLQNLSLYKLSQMTGISRMQLSNYESGASEPTVKNARLICKALKVQFVIQ